MAEPFAKLVRETLPWLQKQLAPLGEIQTMMFLKVGPAGDDHYRVKFTGGSREFSIVLDPEGRAKTLWFGE